MSEDLPPLPDDVLALLAAEKPLVRVDAAHHDRAFARIETAIANAATTAAVVAGAKGLVTLAKGKLAGFIGIAFAVGALTGGATVVALRDAGPRDATPVRSSGQPGVHERPSTATTTAPIASAVPSAKEAESAPTISVDALATAKSPGPSAAPSSSNERNDTRAQGLAAERALLDVARTALARGAPEEALEATQRHGREYAAGLLSEEREALAIRALMALGRRDEAKARAERFRARFPKSLLLPALDATLGNTQ